MGAGYSELKLVACMCFLKTVLSPLSYFLRSLTKGKTLLTTHLDTCLAFMCMFAFEYRNVSSYGPSNPFFNDKCGYVFGLNVYVCFE